MACMEAWRRKSGAAHTALGAAAFTKSDARESWSFAEAAEDHFITVFEKAALFTSGERDGLSAAPRQLEHAAARVLRGTGHRAARDQVPGAEVTPVARVMRHQLRERPVHLREPNARQPDRADTLTPH